MNIEQKRRRQDIIWVYEASLLTLDNIRDLGNEELDDESVYFEDDFADEDCSLRTPAGPNCGCQVDESWPGWMRTG